MASNEPWWIGSSLRVETNGLSRFGLQIEHRTEEVRVLVREPVVLLMRSCSSRGILGLYREILRLRFANLAYCTITVWMIPGKPRTKGTD